MRRYRMVLGTKVGRFRTHRGRYGPGKVHKYLYDAEHKIWHVACEERTHVGFYGEHVDADTEVTCLLCLSGVTRRRKT